MEEKRKSYRPEIKDNRVEKLVNIESLEPGEVFIRSDDIYMRVVSPFGVEDDYRVGYKRHAIWCVDLGNGVQHLFDGRDLVRPVKTTITIE